MQQRDRHPIVIASDYTMRCMNATWARKNADQRPGCLFDGRILALTWSYL